jgi:hypothetical protein
MARKPDTKSPPSSALPTRKISETIIDFGMPLLSQFEGDEPTQMVQEMFKIIICIWNVHAMAMPVWGKPETTPMLRTIMDSLETPAPLRPIVAELIGPRPPRFAQDPRAVGEWHLKLNKAGETSLHCEAHVPPALEAAYAATLSASRT